jgi:predicted HicB family RNase H-like nuclease
MKPLVLRALSKQVGLPPSREETHQTLERPPPGNRRKKTGRTEEFNIRVRPGFKERFKQLAEREKETVGAFAEKLLADWEARGGSFEANLIPAAEARAGRTAELRVRCTPSVFEAVPRVAAARGMLVPELIEDLLAREVERLDPHGGKFGVEVEK